MSNWLLIGFLLLIIIFCIVNKTNCYSSFLKGVNEGAATVINMFSFLLTFVFALELLKSSGIIEAIIERLNFRYGEVLVQMVVRPLSGSSSLAIMLDIYEKYGADSKIAILSTFIHYGCDSSIYVITFYMTYLEVKNFKKTLICGLLINLISFVISILIIIAFF